MPPWPVMLALVLDGVLLAAAAAQPRSVFHGHRSSQPRSVFHGEAKPAEELVAANALPAAFDWRHVKGRSWVTTDLNQHIPVYCGSCWIHGTVHTLNDRIKIVRGARFPDVLLSRQALMNCVPDPTHPDKPPSGCNGGDAWMIHAYMHGTKVPDESCMPYVGVNQECVPKNICRNCNHKITIEPGGHPFFGPGPCFGVPNWIGYGVKSYGNVSGELAMMREIYARGPITCNAATDDEFVYNYTTNPGILAENVYTTDVQYNLSQIDHFMEVTGWGETKSGMTYWVVRNSWGTYWGDLGWVKIRRGVNQMQLEWSCDWAVPDVGDVEEMLEGQAMGDQANGIRVKGVGLAGFGAPQELPRAYVAEVAGVSAEGAALAAIAPEAPRWPSVAMALVCCVMGGLMGSSATRAMRRRAAPKQPSFLG